MNPSTAFSIMTLLAAVPPALAQPLFTNGPLITQPTGGTGAIAGQPLSNADGFTFPGQTFIFSTTGVGATIPADTSVADDFTVTGSGWDLDAVTLYCFQTSQTTPTITTITINLWTAPPFSANSPAPVPDPLLATPLTLAAGPGTFVCHRESPTSTSTVRPVFSYTVSLDGLPNGGRLAPGTYWLEWSFNGAAAPSQNVFVPLVSPRTAVTDHNARLYNAVDGQPTMPRSWFEGREGYSAGVSEGRAYELPFVLLGSTLPACGTADFDGDGDVGTDADIEAFFACLGGNCCAACFPGGADFDADGDVGTDADIEAFFRVLAGGNC